MPIGPVTQADLGNVTVLRGAAFANNVLELRAGIGVFLHRVVVRCTDVAVRSWKNWLLEDPLVRSYKWLRSDMVLHSPILKCDPALTPDDSGIPSDPAGF